VAAVAANLLLLAQQAPVGSPWLAAVVEHQAYLIAAQDRMEVLPVAGVVQGSVLAVTAAQGVWL
jgi:hypothetical protein